MVKSQEVETELCMAVDEEENGYFSRMSTISNPSLSYSNTQLVMIGDVSEAIALLMNNTAQSERNLSINKNYNYHNELY